MKITLANRVRDLEMVASAVFHEILDIPQEDRKDTKRRTGIAMYVRQIGFDNEIGLFVEKPSERAKRFCVEKAIRSDILGDTSSANSADSSKLRFPGSVTYIDENGIHWQFSTSGLQSDEDATVSVLVGSHCLNVIPIRFCENVKKTKGVLPVGFSDSSHYLYKLIHSF